jgi:hypothetical protein
LISKFSFGEYKKIKKSRADAKKKAARKSAAAFTAADDSKSFNSSYDNVLSNSKASMPSMPEISSVEFDEDRFDPTFDFDQSLNGHAKKFKDW